MTRSSPVELLDAFLATPEFLNLWIAIEGCRSGPGVYAGDSMIVWGRNLGFLNDPALRPAFEGALDDYSEPATAHVARQLFWRKHVLLWCARNSLSVEGDFAECGVSTGFGVDVLVKALDFRALERSYWLYDTFAGVPAEQADEGSPKPQDHNDGSALRQVRAKFGSYPNVKIVPGALPDTLVDASPSRLAFLHVDLNNTIAELETLAALLPRMSVGGYLVLDDFGWARFGRQHAAETLLFEALGLPVLELPTGQGVVHLSSQIRDIPADLLGSIRSAQQGKLRHWPVSDPTTSEHGHAWTEICQATAYFHDQVAAARMLARDRAATLPPEVLDEHALAISRAEQFSIEERQTGSRVTYVTSVDLSQPHLVRALLQREIDAMADVLGKLAR